MSQNIQQIFVANPASSMVSTDLLYLGRSPYDTTDDFAITFANFVASIGTATPTASTIPRWDAHVNMSANNFLAAYATTATAAGTTVLTVSSAYNQYFTGSTTQTVTLPVTSTLALGFPFRIVNNSTGVVTVQSSGGNTIQAMAAGSTLLLTCILTSGTTAASWDAQYIIAADVSGAVLLSPSGNQTITAGALILNVGPIIIGTSAGSGTPASIQLYNSAASAGNFQLYNSTVSTFTTRLTNASVGQFTTITFPDPGAATASVAYTSSVSSGYVLLTPPSDQTITAHNLTLATGSFFATVGGYASGSAAGGYQGTFQAYCPTAGRGSIALIASDNAGNYNGVISNFALNASRTWNLPDASGTFALQDANSNISTNNFLPGWTTTATAAGTTALTIASTYYQYWTGSTTQTVTLPHTGTTVGTSYYFVNNSTGNVTVEASGGGSIQVMAASSSCLFTCISAGGTTAGSWNAQYFVDSDVSGAVLLSPSGDQTITSGKLIIANGNLISLNGTIVAGSAAGQADSSLYLFTQTASKGALIWRAADNAGNFNLIFTNASYGQSSTITVPDPGAASANFLLDASASNHSLNYQLTATALVASAGNITALAGNALVANSTTAAKGLFGIQCVDNGGNYANVLTNASTTAARTWTMPDITGTVAVPIESTPSFTVTAATVGDLSVSYSYAQAVCTQIGNMVYANIRMSFTPTFTTASGQIRFVGLSPSVQAANGVGWGGTVAYLTGGTPPTWPASTTTLTCLAEAGTNYVGLYAVGSGTNISALNITNFTSGSTYTLIMTVAYHV